MTDQTTTDPAPVEEATTVKLAHPDAQFAIEVRREDLPTYRTQGWREVKDDEPSATEDAAEPTSSTEPSSKRRTRATQTPADPAAAPND